MGYCLTQSQNKPYPGDYWLLQQGNTCCLWHTRQCGTQIESDWHTKGTNQRLFKISFSTFSQICPNWDQSDKILGNPHILGLRSVTGMVGLAPKWDRLASNGTNPGLFPIRFQCIWRGAPNALKSDLKKPQISPIWGQSDPLWGQTYQSLVSAQTNEHLINNSTWKQGW